MASCYAAATKALYSIHAGLSFEKIVLTITSILNQLTSMRTAFPEATVIQNGT
jgi:hypothetical protein